MRRVMDYLAATLLLILLWAGGSRVLGPFILPSPIDVLAFFVSSLGDSAFWVHIGASTRRIGLALSIAWCVAFPLGLILGYSRRTDRLVSPFVFLTYPVPKVVLLPIFLTLLGLGDAPRVAIIALTAGYQILVVTRDSTRNLDTRYLESFRTLGGTRTQLMRHVLVPAALPDAMTALRVATGTAVAVLFLVESFATSNGLGFFIMDAWGRGDLLEMFSGILAISLLGVGLYEACGWLERRLCPWQRRKLRFSA